MDEEFDYQSDRHCAKTCGGGPCRLGSLITSQIDTAPKRASSAYAKKSRLITSQIDTAPKQIVEYTDGVESLITSQIDTAPKPA